MQRFEKRSIAILLVLITQAYTLKLIAIWPANIHVSLYIGCYISFKIETNLANA